jgi:hypothetical protein
MRITAIGVRTTQVLEARLFLNPSLSCCILCKSLMLVGSAKDKLDSDPPSFSPDELNTFYSSDVDVLIFQA